MQGTTGYGAANAGHDQGMTDEQADERPAEGEQPDPHADDETPYLTLGACHYDPDETSSLIASKPDDQGWIPICEEHRGEAEGEGYEVREPTDPAQEMGETAGNSDR